MSGVSRQFNKYIITEKEVRKFSKYHETGKYESRILPVNGV